MKCQECGKITGKLARVMTYRTQDRPYKTFVGEEPVNVYKGNMKTIKFLCNDCAGYRVQSEHNIEMRSIKPKKGEEEILTVLSEEKRNKNIGHIHAILDMLGKK